MADKGRVQAEFIRDLVGIAGLPMADALAVFDAAWSANERVQLMLMEFDDHLPHHLRKYSTATAVGLIKRTMHAAIVVMAEAELNRFIAQAMDLAPVMPNKEGQFK